MRLIAAVLISLAVFFVVGLFTFADMVDRSTPAPSPAVADGVVALTGASNARITEAMRLLEDGKGRRLLVSGVNPQASRSDMRGVARATQRIYDCCVDLGYEATDTFGNARETAHWAKDHGYRSLILVTSDFHMPRALLALRAALPGVSIRPYPVRTDDLDSQHWWRNSLSMRRMFTEYCKYLTLLTETRLHLAGSSHEDDPAPASDQPFSSGSALRDASNS